TPEPRDVVINAGACIPLRHPHHPTDQGLEHNSARELISTGDLSQQGSKDRIVVKPGNRQDVIERVVRREHVMSISPSPHRSRMPSVEVAPLSIKRLDRDDTRMT